MQVKFSLKLNNVVVNGRRMDSFEIDWTAEAAHEEILAISREWISSKDEIAQELVGLTEVGGLSLEMKAV